MDLLEYYEKAQKVNFNYKDIKNIKDWNEQRNYYVKMLKISWTNTEYRKVWLKVKEHKLLDNK